MTVKQYQKCTKIKIQGSIIADTYVDLIAPITKCYTQSTVYRDINGTEQSQNLTHTAAFCKGCFLQNLNGYPI